MRRLSSQDATNDSLTRGPTVVVPPKVSYSRISATGHRINIGIALDGSLGRPRSRSGHGNGETPD